MLMMVYIHRQINSNIYKLIKVGIKPWYHDTLWKNTFVDNIKEEQKWIKRHTSIHITFQTPEENRIIFIFRKNGLDLDIHYTTELLSNDNVIRPSLQKFINPNNNFAY